MTDRHGQAEKPAHTEKEKEIEKWQAQNGTGLFSPMVMRYAVEVWTEAKKPQKNANTENWLQKDLLNNWG